MHIIDNTVSHIELVCILITYLINHLYDLKQLSGDLYALNDEAAELLTVNGSCIGYKKSW